jgi:hypothetical protein
VNVRAKQSSNREHCYFASLFHCANSWPESMSNCNPSRTCVNVPSKSYIGLRFFSIVLLLRLWSPSKMTTYGSELTAVKDVNLFFVAIIIVWQVTIQKIVE